eukprot:g28820.t1
MICLADFPDTQRFPQSSIIRKYRTSLCRDTLVFCVHSRYKSSRTGVISSVCFLGTIFSHLRGSPMLCAVLNGSLRSRTTGIRYLHEKSKQQKQQGGKQGALDQMRFQQPNGKNKNKKAREPVPLPICPYEYWDTHCHIDTILDKLGPSPSWKEFRQKSLQGNLGGCISVCCERETYAPVMSLLEQDTEGVVHGAFGLHPHESKHWNDDVERALVEAMKHPKVVAWGECGLDYFYMHSDKELQQQAFARQIQLAVQTKKPLVVHSRDAEEDTLRILKEHAPKDWRIHIHCFTSSKPFAFALVQHFPNLCIGFTGALTFPKASALQEVVQALPLSRILTETDGPFMSPVPYRGGIAHPGHIPIIAQKIADLKGVSLEECLAQVRKNIKLVYGVLSEPTHEYFYYNTAVRARVHPMLLRQRMKSVARDPSSRSSRPTWLLHPWL